MSICGIHHAQITIPRGREDDARAFYVDLLGLIEIPKPDVLQGRGGIWLRIDSQRVHAGVEDGVDRTLTKAHLAYVVDDLVAIRDRLTAAGYAIDADVPLPGMTRCELRDPFGNRVELIQPIERADQ
ncbi:MAG TPA: VOC family protein [Thermomicrobiales bacterium]|nr:VOC family protein [Thermomicrobiales bacterium]